MNKNIERENYEILIKVEDEKELYNKFDESCNTISDEIITYIESQLSKKNVIDNLIIKISSKNYIDEEKIKKAFSKYINDKIEYNERKKRFNRVKQIRLFIIGIIFIGLSILIGAILESILYTIISTIGSFAIWEAANIWIVENMESKIEKGLLQNLLQTKIEVIK